MKKLLILGADEAELNEVRKIKGFKNKIDIRSCGVGLIDSAINTSKILNNKNYDGVIFIGSSGTSNKKINLLDIVVSKEVFLASPTKTTASYIPKILKNKFTATKDWLKLAESTSLHASQSFYSPIEITKSKSLANIFLKKYAASCENLELFSIAATASCYNVKWIAISCITNYIGKESHTQWLKNKKNAARLSSKFLEEFLSLALKA